MVYKYDLKQKIKNGVMTSQEAIEKFQSEQSDTPAQKGDRIRDIAYLLNP